jgi:hypothetical protein
VRVRAPKASDGKKASPTAIEERNRAQIVSPIARFELVRTQTMRPRSILSGTAGQMQDRATRRRADAPTHQRTDTPMSGDER